MEKQQQTNKQEIHLISEYGVQIESFAFKCKLIIKATSFARNDDSSN